MTTSIYTLSPTGTLQRVVVSGRAAEEVSYDAGEQSAIQAISLGTPLSPIPSFTTVDKQRRWMLEHLAGAFRVFSRKGYGEGMSGHISLRDPEFPDCFWTNPYVIKQYAQDCSDVDCRED
jgi:hypothetical protein